MSHLLSHDRQRLIFLEPQEQEAMVPIGRRAPYVAGPAARLRSEVSCIRAAVVECQSHGGVQLLQGYNMKRQAPRKTTITDLLEEIHRQETLLRRQRVLGALFGLSLLASAIGHRISQLPLGHHCRCAGPPALSAIPRCLAAEPVHW